MLFTFFSLHHQVKMKSYIIAALAAFASTVSAADGVKGAAEGFAKGDYSLLLPTDKPLTSSKA